MDGKWIVLVGLNFFILAFIIMLDHYFLTGVWFQLKDIHHETFVFSATAMGIGILIGAILKGDGANSKQA